MIRNSNRSGYIVAQKGDKKKSTTSTDKRSGAIISGDTRKEKTRIIIRRERIVASKDGLEVVEVQ